jgi:putative ABC transport system permease protein
MILAEAGLMGLIGGLLGLVFGILLTRIFLFAMTAMSGYKVTYVIPLIAVIAGVLISLVVSQLAAILPARRAAKIRILEAIHYE